MPSIVWTTDRYTLYLADKNIGGFVPVTSGAAKVQTFNMVVQDDTTPMYMYCAQAQHCQQGMVMTINAYVIFLSGCKQTFSLNLCYRAASDTSAYQAAAAKSKKNVPAKKVAGGTMSQIATKQVGKQPK
jgi:hypothetical protein